MVRHNLEYPKGIHNTVNRYKHQATYELTTIHTIINTSPFLHVSFQPPNSPFPITLPLIGQMGSFERPSASISEPLDIYLHGYVTSRIMNLSRSSTDSPASASTQNVFEGKGLPVCVTAAKLDGLVLTLSPNSHNYNYRSAMLFGYAIPVTDAEEKLWAMELITNSVVPDRWKHTRVPPNAAEMSSTQILRVRIESGSAKVREGVPNDERFDLDNPSVIGSVWTGVVPVWEEFGDPIAGPYNEVKDVPEHVTSYVERLRDGNKEYAEKAAKKDAPVKKKEAGGDD